MEGNTDVPLHERQITKQITKPDRRRHRCAVLGWPAIGGESAAVPNFSPDSRTRWIAGVPDGETPIGDDFLQPPSGPGPVTFDRAHPFVDNRAARQLRKQPTNRVADLSNPILQPWVREELRKLNQ